MKNSEKIQKILSKIFVMATIIWGVFFALTFLSVIFPNLEFFVDYLKIVTFFWGGLLFLIFIVHLFYKRLESKEKLEEEQIMKTKIKNLPECPSFFDVPWAKKFLSALGADTSIIKDNWCWEDFGKHFQKYKKVFENFLENAKTGDPSWAAYILCRDFGSPKEWAEKTIENAKTGNPSLAAHFMCRHCGSSEKWWKKIKLKEIKYDRLIRARS